MTHSTATTARYVVRNSSRTAKRGWGTYCEYAVMLVDGSQGDYVSMISLRARGALDIVWTSGRVHVGSTERSASARAFAFASAMAAELNAKLAAQAAA